MIEEAVFRVFEGLAEKGTEHTEIGSQLDELGWAEIEVEYPTDACALLFRAQGRSLAQTDCLQRTLLSELAGLIDGPVDGIVLPDLAEDCEPSFDPMNIAGVIVGPPRGRVVVPVSSDGAVSLGVIDAAHLQSRRMDTFDSSVYWTRVTGRLDGPRVAAATEWQRVIAAARRAIATELTEIASAALRIAVEHARVRIQFGVPIGSFQAPRHALADAFARLEGAKAVLDESWRDGGRMSAQTAKAAAGRAHREVCAAAQQVCGAIGISAEHDLPRYIARGFQLDALCGSYQQLEASLADRLLETKATARSLPMFAASQ
ncbi:acyl-CoA dehydrogenase family protein [Mycobacterium vicinigordonae]|uniref:Acyl-CoA dehydrogenase n=1 Tax=Mycobacterium vicinigordonae TaxID=1719132 RepID=A0A7D6E3T6_9MYCO|nr:acyl-CoA dehydrogenase family protein [Mycobacterium vicinigordonae]QLL10110.1 acyl-CoA dehydrogenase [Mycobacterium vicinigordonae]